MRYIDADEAMEEVNRISGHNLCGWSTLGVKALIDRQPTADVVPKSEVEKIFAEIEKIRSKEIHKCETLREQENEVSQRKYWEGGYNSLRQLSYWIAELKKKYEENQT